MSPVVLNKYKLKPEDKGVYCGRGSPWGNPFAIDEDLGRNTVCDMFEEYVNVTPGYKESVKTELAGKNLICFCKPMRCHCDTLLRIANDLPKTPIKLFNWSRRYPGGYEVSSKGDERFSAFYAIMSDGNSIEWHYQTQIKLYPSIKAGKGKPPLNKDVDLWKEYLNLWKRWSDKNIELLRELYRASYGVGMLTDMFASTPVNQARALATILNEKCGYIE